MLFIHFYTKFSAVSFELMQSGKKKRVALFCAKMEKITKLLQKMKKVVKNV